MLRGNDGQNATKIKLPPWFDGETYFTADEALDVGLIDEILPEPKPSRVKRTLKAASVCAIPKQPTEQELLFKTMLNAFGKIEVSDKASLGRELEYFFNNVREAK